MCSFVQNLELSKPHLVVALTLALWVFSLRSFKYEIHLVKDQEASAVNVHVSFTLVL